MSKKKTKGVKYWKGKAWHEFSRYIRVRDALRTTRGIENCKCCSCGRIYPAFGLKCLQAGHFIPGRHNAVLFNELGCHGQCYNCNVRLKGAWPEYHEFMVDNYGQEAVDYMLMEKNQTIKFLPFELEELRNLYKLLADQMLSTKKLLKGESYEAYRDNIDAFGPYGMRLTGLHSGTAG
jgi:hypothetical protein